MHSRQRHVTCKLNITADKLSSPTAWAAALQRSLSVGVGYACDTFPYARSICFHPNPPPLPITSISASPQLGRKWRACSKALQLKLSHISAGQLRWKAIREPDMTETLLALHLRLHHQSLRTTRLSPPSPSTSASIGVETFKRNVCEKEVCQLSAPLFSASASLPAADSSIFGDKSPSWSLHLLFLYRRHLPIPLSVPPCTLWVLQPLPSLFPQSRTSFNSSIFFPLSPLIFPNLMISPGLNHFDSISPDPHPSCSCFCQALFCL